MVALFSAVTGWLLFAALVTAVGSFAARWVFIPRAAILLPDADQALRRVAGRMGLAAGVSLPFAMALVFLRQLMEFRDPFATWTEDAQLLMSTEWGRTWLYAALAALVVAVLFALVRVGARWAVWPGALGVSGLLFYPALSGHAAGTEGLRSLTIGADALHVLAAGVWIGGLAFVVSAERSWIREAREPPSVLPALVPVFTPLAIAAVSTLIVTGVFAAWVHVAGLEALVTTSYGRLLLAKVGAVLAVMYLGAVNWRRLSPQLASDSGQHALRRNATTELLVAQIVLVVTAVLVRTSPMGH